jgi:hypothetical protein
MDQSNGDDHHRSREEQEVVDSVAETHGEEWAEEHADLILAQSRLVGEI